MVNLTRKPYSVILGYAALILLAILIVFQLLLTDGILPAEITWGGQLSEITPVFRFSSLGAILVLGGFAYVLARRSSILGTEPPSLLLRVVSWLITAYLFLISVISYLSPNPWEKWFFGPLTFILAAISLVISAARSSLNGG
ncbi:MAG: hypothetical protein P8Y34_10395 [Anaerolineales bacterium]|jgi:hypothetical protein